MRGVYYTQPPFSERWSSSFTIDHRPPASRLNYTLGRLYLLAGKRPPAGWTFLSLVAGEMDSPAQIPCEVCGQLCAQWSPIRCTVGSLISGGGAGAGWRWSCSWSSFALWLQLCFANYSS